MNTSEFQFDGKEVLKKIEELLHKGKVNRLRIADEAGKVLIDLPMNYAVVAGLVAPVLAIIGSIVVLTAKYKVTVEHKD